MDDRQKRYRDYLDFVGKYSRHLGIKGSYKKEEIEIVDDIALFPKCEEGAVKLMVDSGTDPSDAVKRSRIGLRDENRWGVNICEPLRLPDGSYTTFVRPVSWGTLSSGIAGVVVAPFLPDGRLILMKNFRHNVRTWCYEFPRGGKDPGNSLLKTLKHELSEEIGARILEDPVKIGEVFPDSGFLASKVEIFKAKVEITGVPSHEATEAIGSIRFVTPKKLRIMISGGEIKDGYTLSALGMLGI
jgi:ADP-ribose pyrophosphatase